MSNDVFKRTLNASVNYFSRKEVIENVKKAFNNLAKKEVVKLLDKKTPLDASKVEKGNIFVSDNYSVENYVFSVLELLPGAKIAWHIHENEDEYYIIWHGTDPECCFIGFGHELENCSSDIMYVLSVKIF